jgi:ABC-type multidrug transport system ATPase subunit
VDCKPKSAKKGINLSGGQRQRVSLARTILHRPNLSRFSMIRYRPLTAPPKKRIGRKPARSPRPDFGKDVTRIMITHRLSHLNVFDQIGFLANGEFKATGKFEHLEIDFARVSKLSRRSMRFRNPTLRTLEGKSRNFNRCCSIANCRSVTNA